MTADASGPKHLNFNSLSQAKFEDLVSDLVERTIAPCTQAIKDAGLSKTEIDEVILVGGSSRIPKIKEKVKKKFLGKNQIKASILTK